MSKVLVINGKEVTVTQNAAFALVKDGLDDIEWAGPGLYVCYAEPQAGGGYGSTTRFWQSLEDYNRNGIAGSHGGTPIVIHSLADWVK